MVSEIHEGGRVEETQTLSNSLDSLAMAARMYSSESSFDSGFGSGFLSDMVNGDGRVHKMDFLEGG